MVALPGYPFRVSEIACIDRTLSDLEQALADAPPLLATLRLAALITLVAIVLPPLAGTARAQSEAAALIAKPVSLPDMAIGQAKAPITIVEYSSLTCPHCATSRKTVPNVAVEIHRHRKGALCVARVPARHQGPPQPRCWRVALPTADAPKYF